MTSSLTRRHLLLAGAAAAGGAGSGLPAGSPSRAATAGTRRLTIGRRSLEVNGKAASVFGITGADGKPGLTLEPGERFAVELANQAGQPAIVHWHGQIPAWTQDGFPWPQTPALAAGATHDYDFAPISGTFWMHSHEGLQEQLLMAAPLIVRDAEAAASDAQEVVVLLHDFSFESPESILAGLRGGDMAPAPGMAGMDDTKTGMPGMPGMAGSQDQSMAGMPGMSGMPATAKNATGSPPMAMDLNDVAYDAFLANDRTLDDPEIVRVAAGQRVRLRLINGATASQFWVDLGRLTGSVIAVDGHAVLPLAGARFPLAIAQRLDLLVTPPAAGAYPILAQLEGKRGRTGIILVAGGAAVARLPALARSEAPPVDLSLEARLSATTPLPPRRPDVVHRVSLNGGMAPYVWSLDEQAWPNPKVLMVEQGQRVLVEMVNRTMMPHPMHLHGHAFQVVALGDAKLDGAVRDTVLVPPMGRVAFAFDADNPGRWAFHCHNGYHMAAGMMTEIRYKGIA